MDQIVDFLYLGDIKAANNADVDTIKTIITVHTHCLPENDRKNGIEYQTVVAFDRDNTDLLIYFPQTSKMIDDRIESKRSVLVHCAAGISRSATVVCAYVMQKYKLNAEQAIAFVRQQRPLIRPNPGFFRQLQLWYQMGYTLNCRDRQFWNHLKQTFLSCQDDISASTYSKRLSIAKIMSGNGRAYCCAICYRVAYNDDNIVENSKPRDGHKCTDVYIDPQIWMKEQMKVGKEAEDVASIVCDHCLSNLATFNANMKPFSCNCAAHEGLEQRLRIKVIPTAVKLYEPI